MTALMPEFAPETMPAHAWLESAEAGNALKAAVAKTAATVKLR
jgi:hypothetical protein